MTSDRGVKPGDMGLGGNSYTLTGEEKEERPRDHKRGKREDTTVLPCRRGGSPKYREQRVKARDENRHAVIF